VTTSQQSKQCDMTK